MPPRPKRRRPKRQASYEWDASKVKALRDHLGLTQTEFAQELGTAQQTVSQWERGNHYPKGMSVKVLNLVAERAAFKYGKTPKEKETAS
jgi:DNA-binding transcriptional regulator YiaG